jgi:hypothetical protein
VAYLGELHDSAANHELELAVLAQLSSAKRPIALSLEMFETDVQQILDDYLAGRIGESEFQNYLTQSLPQLLSEGRKFRVCLRLAHQYLDQLLDDKMRNQIISSIFGNVGTIAAFRGGKFSERSGKKAKRSGVFEKGPETSAKHVIA